MLATDGAGSGAASSLRISADERDPEGLSEDESLASVQALQGQLDYVHIVAGTSASLGASQWQTFRKIVLPMARGGVAASAVLCFIFAWNEFLFANILTGAATHTAPVGLTEYVTPVSVEWNKIMAAGTLVVLPVWIGALSVQRYLVRGISMGAVKG